MSQHNKSRRHAAHRNSPKRQISPWLGLLGITVVVVVIGLLVASNNSRATNNIPSGSGNAATQVVGAPRISVVQDTFDYGDVKLGTTLQTVFHVRNVGDQPLVILNNPQVKVVIGCCPPRAILSSNTIQPGQEATITLTYMMHEGMGGKHRFNIDLQTNDPAEPLKQLVVFSNWI